MSQRLRLLVRGIFLYQYSFLCLRAPKRASYILSECVLEVFNSIGDYWRNRRLCHWKIGIRMKWGHRASGMEILLYSEIYGVGSTAGDFWHNFKIQFCYFITTENICRKKKQILSPHITFYEITLISAYRSYILFSFFIWINIKIDKQKGGKNVNGIVFWFWTRLVRYCVPLPAVESNWQIILDYYPVH